MSAQPIDFHLIATDRNASPTFARIRDAADRCTQGTADPADPPHPGRHGAGDLMAASGLTFDLTLDTSDFDRKIKRIKRQATYARIWTHLWLALYAAAATGAAIVLAVIDLTR